MKIIDLLNKIAKGEEVPKKIRYADEIFTFDNKTYVNEDGEDLFSDMYNWLNDLSIKLEIIEEQKEITGIDMKMYHGYQDSSLIPDIVQTINEIVDLLNDMRDKEC
jgi:plasmid rolling circle replication initiator protein Rep